jgi:hypothetical protein
LDEYALDEIDWGGRHNGARGVTLNQVFINMPVQAFSQTMLVQSLATGMLLQ